MTPKVKLQIGRRSIALAAFFAVILICIEWVDRPIATFVFGSLRPYRRVFDAPTHSVDPLLPVAAVGLLMGVCIRGAGYEIKPPLRPLLLACLSVAVAVMMKEQAKYLFGRPWPETWVDNNPSWIGTGTYGFFPFHGGRGWASFPSGHMSVITAPATVLALAFPKIRPLMVLVVLAVAVGLLGADYHFASDIIAGTGLGTACGMLVVALASASQSSAVQEPALNADGASNFRRASPSLEAAGGALLPKALAGRAGDQYTPAVSAKAPDVGV